MCHHILKVQIVIQLFWLLSYLAFTLAKAMKSICIQMRRHMDMRTMVLINIVFVLVNLFIVVMQLNKLLWPPESYFKPPVTSDERESMLDILKVFQRQLDRDNITYFMGHGTLIGSYRHHGPVPWDDDIDMYVKGSQKRDMIRSLAQLGPRYALYQATKMDQPGKMWKFFMPNSNRAYVHRPFTWPYVDIFFYQENGTHVWDESDEWIWPRQNCYPLFKRPFGNMWINSPCNISYALRDYNIDFCQSRSFSHLFEVPVFIWRQRIIECERLANRFPFVYRNFSSTWRLSTDWTPAGPVYEMLRLASYTVRRVSFVQPACDGLDRRLPDNHQDHSAIRTIDRR